MEKDKNTRINKIDLLTSAAKSILGAATYFSTAMIEIDMNQQGIRYQRVSGAKTFVEILSSPDFKYSPVNPSSIEEEKKFLRLNREKRKKREKFVFAKLVGMNSYFLYQFFKHPLTIISLI